MLTLYMSGDSVPLLSSYTLDSKLSSTLLLCVSCKEMLELLLFVLFLFSKNMVIKLNVSPGFIVHTVIETHVVVACKRSCLLSLGSVLISGK